MRPLPLAALRQVARGRAGFPLRSFVSSAKQLNAQHSEASTSESRMAQLMEHAATLEHSEKQKLLQFLHAKAKSPSDLTEMEIIHPARATAKPETLQLQSPFHGFSRFPYYYLRDLCKCPRCVDPHSNQRSFRTSDIPPGIYPRHVKWDGAALEIKWSNDIPGYDNSHVSSYDIKTLQAGPLNTHENISKYNKPMTWGNRVMTDLQHWVNYDDYMSNDTKFAESMRNLQRMGLIFVKGIPSSRELVKKIAERMGPLRNSFYGETWDVRTVPQAKNVAYTNQHLGFHMDLLYMNEPPGYQLLHCLENSCEGGESLFADSFRAAKIMKMQFPAEFNTLTKRLFGFEYMHKDHMYSNVRPLIELDKYTGEIRNVNYSPPFQAPIPKSMDAAGTCNHMKFKEWRHAMNTFTHLVEQNSSIFQLKLNPGECVIFANRRVVHARNKFNTSSGSRWLAGAYVDEDALLSTFATNAKKFPEEWTERDPLKALAKLKHDRIKREAADAQHEGKARAESV